MCCGRWCQASRCNDGASIVISPAQVKADRIAQEFHVPFCCVAGSPALALVPRPLPGENVSRDSEIAAVLIDIEAQLRQIGQWDRVPPSSQALASDQPFCVDTMTLPQWLQFVFLPTLYDMLEAGEALPERCGIAPMAEEYFRGTGLASGELVECLVQIDSLLSTD
ncbi:MAG: YqcC family protein [Halioglobus sp.]|nr:YqcC family protein [Halioglobus sp.]